MLAFGKESGDPHACMPLQVVLLTLSRAEEHQFVKCGSFRCPLLSSCSENKRALATSSNLDRSSSMIVHVIMSHGHGSFYMHEILHCIPIVGRHTLKIFRTF